VKLPPPKGPASLKRKAAEDEQASEHPHKISRTRSRATERALKREPHASASKSALSRQSKRASTIRGKASRTQAAKKAARTRRSRAS
jgi:hypothetical protein